MARPGLEPMISRSEVDCANYYSMHWYFVTILANVFITNILGWDKKWVLACQSFGECTARVKLELTDFGILIKTKSCHKQHLKYWRPRLAWPHSWSTLYYCQKSEQIILQNKWCMYSNYFSIRLELTWVYGKQKRRNLMYSQRSYLHILQKWGNAEAEFVWLSKNGDIKNESGA